MMNFLLIERGRPEPSAFLTELERIIKTKGYSLAKDSDPLDFLVFSIYLPTLNKTDYDALEHAYDDCALGLLRAVGENLSRFGEGSKKRLCFVTGRQASVNLTDTADHWERMVQAACSMAIRTLFNRLSEEGFTFRVLALDAFSAEKASYAFRYFLQDRSLDDSPLHSDEKRVVMRDIHEREIPW